MKLRFCLFFLIFIRFSFKLSFPSVFACVHWIAFSTIRGFMWFGIFLSLCVFLFCFCFCFFLFSFPAEISFSGWRRCFGIYVYPCIRQSISHWNFCFSIFVFHFLFAIRISTVGSVPAHNIWKWSEKRIFQRIRKRRWRWISYCCIVTANILPHFKCALYKWKASAFPLLCSNTHSYTRTRISRGEVNTISIRDKVCDVRAKVRAAFVWARFRRPFPIFFFSPFLRFHSCFLLIFFFFSFFSFIYHTFHFVVIVIVRASCVQHLRLNSCNSIDCIFRLYLYLHWRHNTLQIWASAKQKRRRRRNRMGKMLKTRNEKIKERK